MTRRKIPIAIALLSVLFLETGLTLVIPGSAHAMTCQECCKLEAGGTKDACINAGLNCLCNPLHSPTIPALIDKIIAFIFDISLALAPLMVIIAGFIFMTAGGNADKINQAKRLLLYTAVGFGIVLFARGLVAILTKVV